MGELNVNIGVVGVIIVYSIFIICIIISERKIRKKKEKLTEKLNKIVLGIDDEDIDKCHCKKRDMVISFSENGIEYCLQCGLDLP